MRPVVKGDGAGRAYEDYRDALDDLANEIGLYCSYCELPIKNAPEVEHVKPKSLEPHLRLEWSNFLLGCKSCNSTKGNKHVDTGNTAFPDKDNTFRGLAFNQDVVEIANGLTKNEADSMAKVVSLVKLLRHPSAPTPDGKPTKSDRRYKQRGEAWKTAESVRQDYEDAGKDAVIGRIIYKDLAPATGFFSIWMTVFNDHPEMLNGFIDAFTGTAKDCFDVNGRPLGRPGGLL